MGKLSNQCFIQQTTLEKLKCTNCKKYLSILPVYKNSRNEAICGRCPVDNTLDFNRDELYEYAIEFQKFPCTNRDSGCLEVLFPIHMKEHEEKCLYKEFECPTRVYNNCIWQGKLSNMLNHFEKSHPTFILNEGNFEVDFVNTHKENYILPFGEDLYVVTREGNSAQGLFALTVKNLKFNPDIEQYFYVLTMESMNRTYKYSVQSKIGTRLEVEGQTVNGKLHDPVTIVANVSIKVENQTSDLSDSDIENDEDLNHEQLKMVECPVCMHYMVPPIYQCEKGHSICKACKDTQSVCPTCRGSFHATPTQNFALEGIIMNMIYPCRHRGCRYKTKGRYIAQHEKSCLFGPFTCPLKEYETCSAVFRVSELFNHVKTMHYESLLELDTVSMPFDHSVIEEDITEAYIRKYSHQNIFKICFMYNVQEKILAWSVQLVGPQEESAKYVYELEILDNSGKNMRMYFRGDCSPLVDRNETFQNLKHYSYWNIDQILGFIKNQLTYRVLISRKA